MGALTKRLEQRTSPWNAADDHWYASASYLEETAAGVQVDDGTAWRSVSVWACVRILAESIASLPLFTYVRQSGGGKSRAWRHPSYRCLHDQANPEQTALQWRETTVAHVAICGNAYSEIVRTNDGRIELWPWNPRRVEVSRDEQGLVYTLTLADSTTKRSFRAPDVLHIAGLAWNGLVGMSPIEYAKETIALSLAEEEYAARFYGTGANVGLTVTVPPEVKRDKNAHDRALGDLQRQYGGLSNAHRIMMLEDGMRADRLGVTPEEAQFLDGRRFTKAQIAALYRIPLHMIQEHEKTTSWGTGIEQFNAQFVMHTLRPWLVRIEQALNVKLFEPAEQGLYFAEFLIDGLLRGDSQARSAYFKTMRELGAMTANQILEIENMNPRTDGGGDTYWEPASNFVPSTGDVPASDADASQTARSVLLDTHLPLLADVLRRALRREEHDVLAALKSGEIAYTYQRNGDRLLAELLVPLRALLAASRRLDGNAAELGDVAGWVRGWCDRRAADVAAVVAGANGSAPQALSDWFDVHNDAEAYASDVLREALNA